MMARTHSSIEILAGAGRGRWRAALAVAVMFGLCACDLRVNHAPSIVPPGSVSVVPDDTVFVSLIASDPDMDNVTLQLVAAPAAALLQGADLSWTPTAADIGRHQITIAAVDDGAPALTTYATLDVEVLDPAVLTPNHAPRIDLLPEQNVLADETLTFTLTATDPDGDLALTWGADLLPPGASFDPLSATFTWTPSLSDTGVHSALFHVQDSGAPQLWDAILVTIRVTSSITGNQPPLFVQWPKTTLYDLCADSSMSVTFVAWDPDGDPITFSWDNVPDTAVVTVTGNELTITWAPLPTDAGDHEMFIAVEDNGGPPMSVSGYYDISVQVSGTATTTDFDMLGTYTAPALNMGDFAVVGSNDIHVLHWNGLGVVGGPFDSNLDADEWMEFSFVTPVSLASYFVSTAGNGDSDGLVGEALVEAWNGSGASLGAVLVDGGGVMDLTTLFGFDAVSRFRIKAVDGDRQIINHVNYSVCP